MSNTTTPTTECPACGLPATTPGPEAGDCPLHTWPVPARLTDLDLTTEYSAGGHTPYLGRFGWVCSGCGVELFRR